MNESASVYQLVTRLCSSLIKESDECPEGFTLNCAKAIAFKNLLGNNVDESQDLLSELQFASFELSLANRNKDSKQVNEFAELLKAGPSEVEPICLLLVNLKNIDPDPESKRKVRVLD